MRFPNFSRGRRKMQCQQDPNSKEVICKTVRVLEDGTINDLAEASFSFDGECNAIPTNLVENEEGELDKLSRKAMPLLRSKCKNRPSDY